MGIYYIPVRPCVVCMQDGAYWSQLEGAGMKCVAVGAVNDNPLKAQITCLVDPGIEVYVQESTVRQEGEKLGNTLGGKGGTQSATCRSGDQALSCNCWRYVGCVLFGCCKVGDSRRVYQNCCRPCVTFTL